MPIDPPGKKYIIDQYNPYSRIPDDAFPEPVSADIDLDDVANCPDGWLLRTITIGYYEDGSMYTGIRFGEADAYPSFRLAEEAKVLDMDWEGSDEAWNVEWAIDDFESAFHELEWTRIDDGLEYKDALRVAHEYMHG